MQIISFTGLAGAGKTTAALHLVERHHFTLRKERAVRESLASSLKDICQMAFPKVPAKHFLGTKEEKEALIPGMSVSGRDILQRIATEGFRALDPDVWVNSLLHAIDGWDCVGAALVTVDDVRFANEATALMARGPLYRIVRPGLETMNHASETAIMSLPVTAEIQNDGTLQDLYEKLDRLCPPC